MLLSKIEARFVYITFRVLRLVLKPVRVEVKMLCDLCGGVVAMDRYQNLIEHRAHCHKESL